mgnify:CR=1 FL=1
MRAATAIEAALPEYLTSTTRIAQNPLRRQPLTYPAIVDECLGAFLGYLIGDGHISAVKRTIGLTTGDEPQADHFIHLTEALFNLTPRKAWDATKWRVKFSSRNVQDFLTHLGLHTGFAARKKDVPACVLRSPKPVVVAFLRALYDCDGYAGNAGVILSTASVEMSKTVQLLLLNFGVLSTRRLNKDGCWHVHTLGRSAEVFQREIGFGLQRKQRLVLAYGFTVFFVPHGENARRDGFADSRNFHFNIHGFAFFKLRKPL